MVELNWKACVLIVFLLIGLHWMEFQHDGQITTICVLIDSMTIFVLLGVVGASTIEQVVIKIVNSYLGKWNLELKEAVLSTPPVEVKP